MEREVVNGKKVKGRTLRKKPEDTSVSGKKRGEGD